MSIVEGQPFRIRSRVLLVMFLAVAATATVCATHQARAAGHPQGERQFVSELRSSIIFRTLYIFQGPGGANPSTGLVQDSSGNLYGTAGGGPRNFGVVFELSPSGEETVLHDFTGPPDGAYPGGSLILDDAGNLYGITLSGGGSSCPDYTALGCGTVFKIDSKGDETVLYAFKGKAAGDGGYPLGSLVRDSKGNLYGTTSIGGALESACGFGCGAVFEVSPKGQETLLHSFTGQNGDGGGPQAGLVMDAARNLYGTTEYGGYGSGEMGYGTVFKIDSSGKETVLYEFCPQDICTSGAGPTAPLILDHSGNLYGTTYVGGNNDNGVVFALDASGHETVLHTFLGMPDGSRPYAGLVRDFAGNLYGTTESGGYGNHGTVFKIDASGRESVFHRFCDHSSQSCIHGRVPFGGLILDSSGNVYGTDAYGGDAACVGAEGMPNGCGVVFKITQ